ncbi:seryl-tRNA synthetase [Rickenella mellea]|uniref:serine--tRNA ligase n=1 Tax=Rickenella mellea TaxID=50990 RepID=A0A4Y7QKT1_9AGAM|nr:seryl-tRNA synthetase [Rickenella mellea]
MHGLFKAGRRESAITAEMISLQACRARRLNAHPQTRRRPLANFSRCNDEKGFGSSHSSLPKPRLDYRAISENVLFKSHNAFNRKSPMPVGAVQSVARLYQEHRSLSSELNRKVHARSLVGDKIRDTTACEKSDAILEAKVLKEEIMALEDRLSAVDDEMLSFALTIPNDTHPETPIGSENAAVTIRTCGPTPLDVNPARDHLAIGRKLNLLDFEAGAAVTGSSWYYLLNEGALLETALTQFVLKKAIERGYKIVLTPDVVKSDIAGRCGFHPRDDSASQSVQQMYQIRDGARSHPELVLSGTAEIPLAGYFVNKTITEGELPIKLVGVGKAFRAEAGARGADTRGLYRVHQFTKAELFIVCEAGQSDRMMDGMVDLQIAIFSELGFPFRVLDMPTEELGSSSYRKYDMEAWMPGRGGWGEISSTSNCTDYQSRRLHIRHRQLPRQSESKHESTPPTTLAFTHTLNGTAGAIPRLIVALLENGARFDDGANLTGINLPCCLKPFWLGSEECGIANINWI